MNSFWSWLQSLSPFVTIILVLIAALTLVEVLKQLVYLVRGRPLVAKECPNCGVMVSLDQEESEEIPD